MKTCKKCRVTLSPIIKSKVKTFEQTRLVTRDFAFEIREPRDLTTV
jgi:hypothetical protein